MSSASHRPVVYLVKQLQSGLRAALDEAVAPTGLSTPEMAVLRTLQGSPGLSNAGLARAAFVKPQSMTPLLKSLEAKGLVLRMPDPAGGRALAAELTPLGRERLLAAAKAVMMVEARMLTPLAPDDRRRFAAMLEACLTALRPESRS